MKQTLTKDTFRFLFNQVRPNQFSYEAQGLLFDYLVEHEDICGIEMEFDPIAICCDFAEMTIDDIINSYCFDCSDVEESDIEEYVSEQLMDKTAIVGFTTDIATGETNIVFQQF